MTQCFWTEEQDRFVLSAYLRGLPTPIIAAELLGKFQIERSSMAVKHRIIGMRKKGVVVKIRKVAGNKWSDDESARMFELLAAGSSLEDIAAALNAEFHTDRTPSKVSARRSWVKAQGRKQTKKSTATKKSAPKTELPVLVNSQPPESRRVRVDFAAGYVDFALSGNVPEKVRKSISEIVLAGL